MGLAIDRDVFSEEEYARFRERLDESLGVLEQLLARPGFGVGPSSLGAEIELSLVDDGARPLPRNLRVIAEALDPRVTVELDRFNLECNLRHCALAGHPFTTLARELDDAVGAVRRAARTQGGRVAAIGILPTLHPEDLQSGAMTDTPRFRALSAALQRLRSEPFRIRIDGEDPLDVECDDVTFEGAATSFQVHLRVAPGDFRDTFDAVQLATAPVLAAAGNSPLFLGHRLWEETRVALFKQAVDARSPRARRIQRAARVSFGRGWLESGAAELFAEAVALYEVLLPVLSDEDPVACLRAGGLPRLEEVRLHQGTVWRWNRPVYDGSDGGHLRIEMRALPSGPTTIDMLANAAFLVGLGLGLRDEIATLRDELPFEILHHGFYRAAQLGLEAQLPWPGEAGTVRAHDLVPRLLPIAASGLRGARVDGDEIESLLAIVAARCASGQTGAVWQRRSLAAFERDRPRDRALERMLELYMQNSAAGEPVHAWDVAR